MEKIGPLVKKIIRRKTDALDLSGVFSPDDMRYISGVSQNRHTLFVYLKSSAQVFEFNLKRQAFLEKIKSRDRGIDKLVFRVS